MTPELAALAARIETISGKAVMVAACPDCGSTSAYHRRHPITGAEFDYDHACSSCVHETRTKGKHAKITCALNRTFETPPGQSRPAFTACAHWRANPSKVGGDPADATIELPSEA